MEYKSLISEFKADGDRGEFEGHFSVFGNVDDGADVIHPGAFAKTIAERGPRVKMLYGHMLDRLVGPAPRTLKEDAVGLYAAGRLTLDSMWGREVWTLLKDGALSEGSIGYDAVKFDYENPTATGTSAIGQTIRNLRELKLYELSFVPLGMNPLTQIDAIKSLATGTAAPDIAIAGMTAAIDALVAQTKAGRVLSAANLDKARAALDSLNAAIEVLASLIQAAKPNDADDDKSSAPHFALIARRARALGQAIKTL